MLEIGSGTAPIPSKSYSQAALVPSLQTTDSVQLRPLMGFWQALIRKLVSYRDRLADQARMRWLTRPGYGAVTVRLAVLLALPAVGVCVVSTPEVALGSVENPVPVTVSVTGDVVTVGTGEMPVMERGAVIPLRLKLAVPSTCPVSE